MIYGICLSFSGDIFRNLPESFDEHMMEPDDHVPREDPEKLGDTDKMTFQGEHLLGHIGLRMLSGIFPFLAEVSFHDYTLQQKFDPSRLLSLIEREVLLWETKNINHDAAESLPRIHCIQIIQDLLKHGHIILTLLSI